MPEKLEDKIISWVKDPEEWVIDQVHSVAQLSFVTPHVALMPDAHVGKGSTIGSVIPTQGAVIPSAVGVDLGCGMIAARSNLTSHDLPDDLSWLHADIAKAVPAGVGQGHGANRNYTFINENAIDLTDKERDTASAQLGSLGSGNHFIEISLDEDDNVWVVLHSGSRGVGNQLATKHINHAKGLLEDYFGTPEDPDLAYLVKGTLEYDHYIAAMLWAQDYAMANRTTMMDDVQRVFSLFMKKDINWDEEINCHHNFAAIETHFGEETLITRKGAIRARKGDYGIIPGSMGTSTFIVEGKGNKDSFCSCSHGAGRKMSRTKAKKNISFETLESQMAGKTWNKDKALLDEAPDAYKDIHEVMAQQDDLVTIKHELKQILNYKGVDKKKW